MDDFAFGTAGSRGPRWIVDHGGCSWLVEGADKKAPLRFRLPGWIPGLANRRGEEPQSQEEVPSRSTFAHGLLRCAESALGTPSGPNFNIEAAAGPQQVPSGTSPARLPLNHYQDSC